MNREPNALDRASFYVEELKYGPGPKEVEEVSEDEALLQFTKILADTNVTSIEPRELMDATRYYGLSTARSFGIPYVLALSTFVDGMLHGMALAAGLEGPPPQDDIEI